MDATQNSQTGLSAIQLAPKQATPTNQHIVLTPYPVEPGHTLISISRLGPNEWRPEMRSNASYVAEGANAGIVINKPASIMDYNRAQAAKKERIQPPSAKMSFKVFLLNSETGKLTLEHRTLRFWLDHDSNYNVNNSINQYTNNNNNNNNNNNESNPARENYKSTRTYANIRQESSHLAQAYFCQLIGSKPDDDFPKNYVAFLMKLMRLLKLAQFSRVVKMEVELRQLPQDESSKPPSRASSLDGGSESGSVSGAAGANQLAGRGSPLTSQRVLDIIESAYPNPISVRDICASGWAQDEAQVRHLLDELSAREKINSTDNGQHFTRTIKPSTDTKVQLVRQMPHVQRAQQPVIAIITAQYCEKLAVDAMISDKETFVRYHRTTAATGGDQQQQAAQSANYVYTLGNISAHRVVSTKLPSIGHSRDALIAAGNATTRLLGTFPGVEYVFLVGCGGGVTSYTDFAAHVRLGDLVVSHVAPNSARPLQTKSNSNDYVYVHCQAKQVAAPAADEAAGAARKPSTETPVAGRLPNSYSVHQNLKRANGTRSGSLKDEQLFEERRRQVALAAAEAARVVVETDLNQLDTSADSCSPLATTTTTTTTTQEGASAVAKRQAKQPVTYEQCHFRLWRPAKLDLQQLSEKLWLEGLQDRTHRIWEYYIDEGIKSLKQQDVDATRPPADTDKLFMPIGPKDTIEVSHPEPAEDEVDLRREGRPMCHFGPIGSGKPAMQSEQVKQEMVDEFQLRAFDSEFDPVVESIYGNCKESYIMIRGISDYRDGNPHQKSSQQKKEWQQYSALVAAAFMKSIIVKLNLY